MQLFGLVNHLLANKYSKRNFTLAIQVGVDYPGGPNAPYFYFSPLIRPRTLHSFPPLLPWQTYFVLPLAPNLGLIEWVPSCDTMHMLVRDYRDAANIPMNLELKLMTDKTYWQSDYDSLPVVHKVEIFQYALDRSAGDDLARVRRGSG